jgi:acyl dehydratase
MSTHMEMRFFRRPSTAAFMLRALYPSPGLSQASGFPLIRASWRQFRVEQKHLSLFLRLTGLHAGQGLPMLYPHVFSFPLQMVILTHPAHPLPIWNSLQIRNHLIQHQTIAVDAVLDLETRVAGQRILEKGAEVDLYTSVCARDQLVWESLNTFYYRGRFGAPGAASPLAAASAAADRDLASWHMPAGTGWRFGGLTGDYNGLHWSRWYARLFGFRQAFHHPQLVLGQCATRLQALDPGQPQRLDAWLKGPVYYGSDVCLRSRTESDRTVFSLNIEGDERPAILGCWRQAGMDENLPHS